MTLLVVMMGLPGSGKSHWARWIGTEIDAAVIDKDVIKSALMVAGEKDWLRSGGMSYEVLCALSGDILDQGRSLIVDAPNCYRRVQQRYISIADRNGAGLKLVECQCRDDMLRDRRLAERPAMRSQPTSVGQLEAEYGPDSFQSDGLPALLIDTSRGDDARLRLEIARYLRGDGAGLKIGPSLLRIESAVGV